MILPPTEDDIAPFLAQCVRRGEVRDVRKLRAANDDDEIEDERRERLREAKHRSRQKNGRRGW